MKQANKLLAMVLAALLLLPSAVPAAAAGNSTILISSPEDLMELSRNCSLDGWSRGKTVELTTDLDLTGTEFQPIPTFGGTFDGKGHRISGLSITGSSNVRGLFRYIQPEGIVKNLTVQGTVDPTDRKDTLGGIAGSSSGRIMNCSFQGTLEGNTSVGGIAGVNEASGRIINCSFSGSVAARHYVGGIAGQNYGSVIQCANNGSINTVEVENTATMDDLNREQLNAAENTPVCTDIGGIAGFSSGILQGCRNTGSVGYAHVGYNIGGIVGRHSGYLDCCVNTGFIQGRKDVGGIAGQMEPEVLLKYNRETLNDLWDELDTLQDMMDDMLNDTDGISSSLSAQLHSLSDDARTAQTATKDLTDALSDWANESIDQVNELSARMSWALEEISPILEDTVSVLEDMDGAADYLDDALDEMQNAGGAGRDSIGQMKRCLEDARQAMTEMKAAMDHLRNARDALRSGLGDVEAQQAALSQLSSSLEEYHNGVQAYVDALLALAGLLFTLPPEVPAREEVSAALGGIEAAGQQMIAAIDKAHEAICLLRDALPEQSETEQSAKEALEELRLAAEDMQAAAQSLDQAMEHMSDALEALDTLAGYGENAADDLEKACDRFRQAFSDLTGIAADLSNVVQELADKPTISMQPLGSTITDRGDALSDAFSSLLDSADELNDLMAASSDTLLEDLRAISRQMGVIIDLLREESEEQKENDEELEDRFEDISDQGDASAQDTGRISSCKNSGQVKGDVNVAGIVGSMAIEYDFDPEDDLTEAGDRSLDFRYQAKAVVFSCVNTGEITGKRDYVGGIVGRMDLGRVTGSEGYGTVSSTDGSYVGGIAGASWGTIQNSWVRCSLEGTDYIGGIAGYGSNLENCHTLADIREASAYVGALAGDVDEDGRVRGNTFTNETVGAIDGISYVGKAEPVSFDTLCTTRGVPAAFSQLELTFAAEGKTVAVIPFQYGKGIESLPEIPAKKGYSAEWPEIDYAHLTASQTLEAIYTPYTSSLTDEGELPQILVDGSFSSRAEVSHTTRQVSWTDETGTVHEGTAYTVKVEDPMLKEISYTVHCRLPEGKNRYELWVNTDGTWTRQAFTLDGSYLMFSAEGTKVTFSVQEKEGGAELLLCLGVLLAGAAAGIVVFKKKRSHAA